MFRNLFEFLILNILLELYNLRKYHLKFALYPMRLSEKLLVFGFGFCFLVSTVQIDLFYFDQMISYEYDILLVNFIIETIY